MRKLMLLLLFSCISLSALASDPNEHWLEAKSPHFVVLTDTNEKQARRIAGQFEQMRSVFNTILPHASDDAGSPIVVLALKDRKAFRSLEPASYLGKDQLDLAGLFISAQDKHYILLRLDAQGEHPFATVYHEYTHYMLRKAPWLPLWLNEGLAEFYQNTDIHDKDVLVGQPSGDDIYYLRENRLLPLATLLKVDYASPYYHDEQKGSVFYSESWALTHYLVVTDRSKNTHHLTDYVQALARNQDSVTAAQAAFGDLNQLQKTLEGYIRQGAFAMFKMNVAVPVDTATFQVRPVPAPEADAVRADVLINTQRNKEAEALLETSLRDDPNNALAHEAMGSLKFREGDIAAAQKWYAEAVQLDSQSYLAHYYFAAMSMQSSNRDHDAAIESSLRAAIKLNPAFAPSYDSLATFYATRDRNLGEAHMLNIQAVQLDPENLNYRLNAASVLSQQRLNPGAIGILKAALPVAKTPDQVAALKTRIGQLEKFQAQLDRAETQKSEATGKPSAVQQNGEISMATASPDPSKTMVFRRVDGKIIGKAEETPNYPAGNSNGPHHTIAGVLRDVRCSYPNVLSLSISQAGKTVTLYTNNYYKVVFTTANYEPDGDIKPCIGIEDMKASVKYAEVSGKAVAGQILAIELSK
jgi:tetratricopeptide (TPR) repeat protein